MNEYVCELFMARAGHEQLVAVSELANAVYRQFPNWRISFQLGNLLGGTFWDYLDFLSNFA
jgi:hypothetical protein